MKKIIYTVLTLLVVLSCSSANIIPNYNVPNSSIKNSISKKLEGKNSIDLKVLKASIKVEDVYVKNHKVNVVLGLETTNVLGAMFNSQPSKGTIVVETDVRYSEGKLYAKNPRISDIKGITGSEEIKAISNAIIYTLLDEQEIYNFDKNIILGKIVQDVFVGDNNIVVDFK